MRVANKIMQGGEEIILGPKAMDLVDYVIEQGSNYTKWYGGKLECWGDVVFEAESGNSKAVYFPIPFISNPVAITSANYKLGSGGDQIRTIYTPNFSSNDGNIYRSKLDGGTPTIKSGCSYYAVGRWK